MLAQQRIEARRKRAEERRKRREEKRREVPPAAYTVPEFCEAHRISRATFYNQKNAGLGPALMYVNARVLITFEAAADWRRERTASAAK